MDDIDDDWPDEDWSDDPDDDELDAGESVSCPECGQPISELIDKCPSCGYWLTEGDRRRLGRSESRPRWQKITAAVFVVAFVLILLLAGIRLF